MNNLPGRYIGWFSSSFPLFSCPDLFTALDPISREEHVKRSYMPNVLCIGTQARLQTFKGNRLVTRRSQRFKGKVSRKKEFWKCNEKK